MKKHARIVFMLTVYMVLAFQQGHAQKYQNQWRFGYHAGVDFNPATPIAVTNSIMNASEGCASIADANGNLLFYTDGSFVFDKTNNIMPNANGNLLGSYKSAQSSIIVPNPGNSNQYYIFTIGDWQSGPFQLDYSIVDITLKGNGTTLSPLGDIVATSKNILLHSNVAEQVTVARSNCSDLWIITHEMDNNNFVAFKLTTTGVDIANSVVSSVGTTRCSYSACNSNRYGYLRMAHRGNKVCSTLGGLPGADATVELFDFDKATGIISNQIVLAVPPDIPNAYCSEFSDDDSKLYVTGFSSSSIYQFDMNATNIAASKTDIVSATSTFVKPSLQLGPDNKIYVAESGLHFLGAIANPNLLGTLASYSDNVIDLGNAVECRLGLPNFVPAIITSNTIAIAYCSATDPKLLVGSQPFGNNCTPTYQWQRRLKTSTIWGPIVGATGKDYTVPIVGANLYCYRRVVTCCGTTSNSNDICTLPAVGPGNWPVSAGGIHGNALGTSVVTDADGNIYNAGIFTGLVSFMSANSNPITIDNGGTFFSAYVAKYNHCGDIEWATQVGPVVFNQTTPPQASIQGSLPRLAIDQHLNGADVVLVATGISGSQLVFYNGSVPVSPPATISAQNNNYAFIAKYDGATGNYISSNHFVSARVTSGANWSAYDCAVTTSTVGFNTYYYMAVDEHFDGSNYLTTILRYNGNNLSAVPSASITLNTTTGVNLPFSLAHDNAGNIFVAGKYGDINSLFGLPATPDLTTLPGDFVISPYVLKLNSALSTTPIWALGGVVGGSGDRAVGYCTIAVAPGFLNNTVYLAGNEGNISFGALPPIVGGVAFILKVRDNGGTRTPLLLASIPVAGRPVNSGIAIDKANNNPIVAGTVGFVAAYAVELNSATLGKVWQQINGSIYDGLFQVAPVNSIVDVATTSPNFAHPADNTYITGGYSGTLALNQTLVAANGNLNMFMGRIININTAGAAYGREGNFDEPQKGVKDDVAQVHEILLYPNPAQTEITVAYPGSDYSTIEIKDLLGRVIISKKLTNVGIEKLDISPISIGVYIFELKSLDNTKTFKTKIVKE